MFPAISVCPFAATGRVLLTLWAGSLWVTGFMVAPLLFTQLDDRALAGTLAGKLFAMTAVIGLLCGVVLLVFELVRRARSRWRIGVLVAMLLMVAAGHFGISPAIAELRAAGEVESVHFARLHGAASILFALTALLALVLVIAGPKRPAGADQSAALR